MSYVFLYFVLFLISNVFRDKVDFFDLSVVWILKYFLIESFKFVNEILGYVQFIKNILIIFILFVIIQIFICMMVGYGFVRFRFKEREIFFGIFFFIIIVFMQIIIVLFYVKFRYFDFFYFGKFIGFFIGKLLIVNFFDMFWIFYILNIFGMGICLSFYIFIFRQFFRNMLIEFEEVVKIDGCGLFFIFLRVMVLNVIGVIIMVFFFIIVWYWNDYYFLVMFFIDNLFFFVMLIILNERMNLLNNFVNVNDIYFLRLLVLEVGCLLVILFLIVIYIIG